MHAFSDIEFLRDLPDDALDKIEKSATIVKFQKRENVFSEGDESAWFYIVKDGKVKITKLSYEGKEIILEIISSGSFFGGIAVLRGFPYPANAVAMEPTEAYRISRAHMLDILKLHPDVMLAITQSIGDRIRDSHETAKNIALEKVGARMAALLLKLADKAGAETPEGTLIDMKLTKQDLAEMVGTTVETSIRTMSAFKKAGLIAESGGRIVIKDRDGLEDQMGQ